MKPKTVRCIFAVAVAIFFAGCESKTPAPPPLPEKPTSPSAEKSTPASAKTTFLVGFSQCTFEDPWRINMNREMEQAAGTHPELKLIIANGENRNAKQIADVQNFIVKGVDALIISPREAAPLTAAVAQAYERGIPVIVLDRRVVGEKYTTFIGASNLDIGRAAGKYLVEALKARGGGTMNRAFHVVEIQGILGATATMERHQGFREAIAGEKWISVVYDQPGDYKRSPAKQIMENALQAVPVIDAVYAHNDEMAIGAFLAAQAAGREKQMIFIGIDGQGEAVKMIRDGLLSATFVYPNGAKEAIELVLKILKDETPPREIKLETTRITKDEHPEYAGF